jgi:molybdate transport system substrate-binding protein
VVGLLAALVCSTGLLAKGQTTSLFAYVGAGIKDPVIALAARYERQTGVKIEMTFNNMGTLLNQLELSKAGDLFIPGGMVFIRKALQAGLILETSRPIAYHVPVIIVPKNNPLGIRSIQDLARPGVKLILPDRKATALGISIFKVFDRLGITASVDKNILSFVETPEKVVVAMRLGQGDAGIVDYSATFRDTDRFKIIEIDPSVNEVEAIPCAVLGCSGKKEAALDFMRFAEKEGPAAFAEYGFKTHP